MRVVLTGATGVVGSAVLRALVADGHDSMVLVRDPSRIPPSPRITPLTCDLSKIPPSLAGDIARFKPDCVIHASWHGSENSERNKPHHIESNIHASGYMLEAAIAAGCRRWIEFGSQAEYSPNLSGAIGEDAPTQPDNSYGAAKIAMCRTAATRCAEAGVHFSWLRLFTCYAREYKPGYIIPYLIETLRGGDMPSLRTPHAIWDCLHADDAAKAVLNVMSHPAPDGICNLASGHGVSVGDMALIIAEIVDFPQIEQLRDTIATNPTPTTQRVADISKFSTHFNWEPSITIREGLKRCL